MADFEDALVASAQIRGRQENLTFFAFTATPKAKTLEMFGERVTTPAGGAAVPAVSPVFDAPGHRGRVHPRRAGQLHHLPDLLPARERSGLRRSATAFRQGRLRAGPVRVLHPTNLAQKAEIIVEHFRAHTHAKIGGRAKAMVVTRSRPHAVKYWQAITAYITAKGYDTGADPVRALVAFSGTVIDPDAPTVEYREALLNGFGEAALPKKFAGDDYQVLIVAEKYQTGLTSRCCTPCNVDKRLDGVKAVQTLSRLNRTYPARTTRSCSTSPTTLQPSSRRSALLHRHHRRPDRPERALHPCNGGFLTHASSTPTRCTAAS